MSEKEQLRFELAKILARFVGSDDPYAGTVAIDQILKAQTKTCRIAVVRKEGELPKCKVEYNPLACGAEDDTDNCYLGGWEESQEAMSKAGYVQEAQHDARQ